MLTEQKYDLMYDAGGDMCGQLLLNLKILLDQLKSGTTICVKTYDAGASRDLEAWCRLRNHTFIGVEQPFVFIRK